MAISTIFILPMSFPERLAALRKERGFTQQQMADKIGMHISQFKRYEGGVSQPTIEVFRRIALALSVSADTLLFEEGERGPEDHLRLQFEAVSRLEGRERDAVETVLAGILHMHDAKRWHLGASMGEGTQSEATQTEPIQAKMAQTDKKEVKPRKAKAAKKGI
jgi:transcriptional regulator with XRE-family HTH domain